MNKILTVYDDVDPLNNVISALTLGIDEIFYVYHVHGIFQARVLEWGAIAFYRGSS